MSIPFIDLAAQQERIREGIEERISAVLDHGRYILGPEVGELETRLAEYVGTRHCIAVSSGSDALLLAFMAFGIKAGDEVITTPFSFIATAEMISLLGARPVFVDIDPETYNLDPGCLEEAVTPRTRAILPVSLYGQCADFDAINAIAEQHDLPVIEDAAQSFGATYKGRRSCALSTVGCTSFFPSKPLGCYGDGGACFTNSDALAENMRQLRVHGQDRRYHHPMIGINGRMDTLQAAVLLEKLDIFPDEVERRRDIGQRYTRLLADRTETGCQGDLRITAPYITEGNTSVYAQYTIRVTNRDTLAAGLQERGIPTAIHYPVPLHLQPAFADLGYKEGDFPNAEQAAAEVLSLPMHPYLDSDQQDEIIDAVCAAAVHMA